MIVSEVMQNYLPITTWFSATSFLKKKYDLQERVRLRPERSCRTKKKALLDKDVGKTFVDDISSLFQELLECMVGLEEQWQLFKSAAILSSSRVCGQK